MTALRFLSESKLDELRKSVEPNLERYVSGDFLDLERENGWAIASGDVTVDLEALAALDESFGRSDQDVEASIIVHGALKGMTPAMAREERVWARLTHVECLRYGRTRWISGVPDDMRSGRIAKHMFGAGLTGVRDDNAIGRLWWNMQIATIADPDDPVGALRLFARTADTRQAFVERTNTASRRPLARAVVRALRRHEWLSNGEKPFRHFMVELNREGGGVLFEAVDDASADSLMDRCVSLAQRRLERESGNGAVTDPPAATPDQGIP